jgi:hypothetical protein
MGQLEQKNDHYNQPVLSTVIKYCLPQKKMLNLEPYVGLIYWSTTLIILTQLVNNGEDKTLTVRSSQNVKQPWKTIQKSTSP